MQLLKLSLTGRIVCCAVRFERAGVFSVWFGCQVLRRAAETCLLNVHFVCTGLWGRCQICGEEGCWQPGTWCAVWHLLSPLWGSSGGQLRGSSSKELGWPMFFIPHQSLSSPQLKDGIRRREDQLPGGVPSLAVKHFRSPKAGVQASDGSLPPKDHLFSSLFFSGGLEVKV